MGTQSIVPDPSTINPNEVAGVNSDVKLSGTSGSWMPWIAGGAGLAGSLISSNSAKNAASSAAAGAQFNPYNSSNLFGGSTWDPTTRTNTQTLSPWAQQVATGLQGSAINGATNPFYSSTGQQYMQQGAGDLGQYYQQAQDYGGLPQSFVDQMNAGYSGLSNYQDVADKQYGLLTQQAQPGIDQQTNALFARLQGQGRLGSTGGGRDITAFSSGLGQADVARQLAGQQLGMQAQTNGLNILNSQGQFGLTADNTNYSRANDRVARANDLFGFGSTVNNTGTTEASNSLGLLGGLAGQTQDTTNVGIQSGQAAAQAGANAGQFTTAASGNPLGSFLSGAANSYLGSAAGQSQLSNLFSNLTGNSGNLSDVQTGRTHADGSPAGTAAGAAAGLGIGAAGAGAGAGTVGTVTAGALEPIGAGALEGAGAVTGTTAGAAGAGTAGAGTAGAAGASTAGTSAGATAAGAALGAVGTVATVAGIAYAAYRSAQKDPSMISGKYDPATGQVQIGTNKATDEVLQSFGLTQDDFIKKMAPILALYKDASSSAGFDDKSLLKLAEDKGLVTKQPEYNPNYGLGHLLPAQRAAAQGVTKDNVLDSLVYTALNQKHGLWTGTKDVMGAVRDANRATNPGF